MRHKLSQRFVAALPVPSKDTVYWDSEQRGFYLRHRPGSRPVWGVRYRFKGKTKTVVIGWCDEIKIEKARARATEIRATADLGSDPFAADVRSKTIRDLAEEHQKIHTPPKIAQQTWDDRRAHWNTHILPELGDIIVRDLSRADVEKFHLKFKAQPSLANRLLATLSKALNDSITFRPAWRTDNPAARIKKFPENKRTRILSIDEIKALAGELSNVKRSNQPWSNVAWLFHGLLISGLRLSELSMRKWTEIDLDKGTLLIPKAKNGKRRTVMLSSGMVALLRTVPRTSPVWVFPNSGRCGPYLCPHHHWQAIRKAAGIPDVRLHDLRHTVASYAMHDGGLSQREVMELLGHNQMSTTERYLNLHDERKQTISERASKAVLAALVEG
jgi:integrase